MNLIKITPNDDPSKIAHINMKNSIIGCFTENNTNVEVINKSIFLKNSSDIFFSNQKILSNNFTIINYMPNIKWCFPNDITLTFNEATEFREKSYFSDIYITRTLHVKNTENTLMSNTFNIYVDRSRSKEMGKIQKNEYLLEVNFEYKLFSEVNIESIYLIQNNYCFQEFEQHFGI